MKSVFSAIICAAALSPSGFAAAAQPAPATASQAGKGIWIDVRTPQEFQTGHLNSAVNIPHNQIAQKIQSVSPNKNTPINLYCRSGKRAEAALETLKNWVIPM